MNSITLFLGGAFASILLSWILVHLLRSSLAELLEELWASRARAGFWAAVACVTILLLGVFGGTSTGGYSPGSAFHAEKGFFAVVSQLRWTMFGLFCALMAVSFAVMIFMSSVDRRGLSRQDVRIKRALEDAKS